MKKSKGKWRVSAFIDGKRAERYFTNKSDATLWKAEKVREKELFSAGIERPDTSLLLIDFASKWLRARTKTNPKSSWKQDETKLAKYILPTFGKRPITHIRSSEWRRFLDEISDGGAAPSYRNRFRSLLHKLYRDAIREGIAVQNPISQIPLVSEKGSAFNYWKNDADIVQYLGIAKTSYGPLYKIAIIALNTGMRISEIICLKWEDLDVKHRTIRVSKIVERITGKVEERTKSGSGRLVPMNDTIATAFSSGGTGPIFIVEGKLVTYWQIRRAHVSCMRTAGVEAIRIHDMRHTFASHYLMNGGSKSELKEILGHSSELVTEGYSHIAQDHLRSRINVISFGLGTREKRGKRLV